MKFIIIALTGIALVLNAIPASARLWQVNLDNVKWDRGCDFYGRDIQCQYGVITNCAHPCMHNAECTHFTSQGDRCCIKKSDSFDETTSYPDAICGFIPWRSNQRD